MRIVPAILCSLGLSCPPASALTVEQVIAASDLIQQVKSDQSNIDQLDKVNADASGNLYVEVVAGSGIVASLSPCGNCWPSQGNISMVISVPKKVLQEALASKLATDMKKLEQLGVK